MDADAAWGSIGELKEAYRARRVSPVEVTRALIERAERAQPRVNAFIAITAERALARARETERRLMRGEGDPAPGRFPLLGVPITLKDLYDQRGLPTTAGSAHRQGVIARADATVTRRLFRAGAISLGKTNTHELAWGVSCDNPHFGAIRNPWDVERIPGGSSGGAGAAVALGIGLVGMGSDTGGSVRIPAALCGVVGLKATYGLVPLTGIVPLYPTQDHAGPLTRTVADAALVLSTIAGYDRGDAASVRRARQRYEALLDGGVAGLRVGRVVRHREGVDGEVLAAVDGAAAVLERLGAKLVEVAWPDGTFPATRGAMAAEGGATHQAAFAADPEGFGPEARKSMERALEVRAVDYLAARRAIGELRGRTETLFVASDGGRVDVLLGPTTVTAAPRLDAPDDEMGALVRLTAPYNLAGVPAISVPCGFTKGGMPVGLQIAGRLFDEATVLRVAHAYERETEWHRRWPRLA